MHMLSYMEIQIRVCQSLRCITINILFLGLVITTLKFWSGIIQIALPQTSVEVRVSLHICRITALMQRHCVYLKKLKNKNKAIRKLSKSKQVEQEEKKKKSKKAGSKAKIVSIYIYIWSLKIQVVSVLLLFTSEIEISRCQYKNILESCNTLKEIESHAPSILLFN